MSVGPNAAGITPKVAQQIAALNANRALQNNQARAANTANTSLRSQAIANANRPATAPAIAAGAVSTPGAPVAPSVGGTTAPTARGPQAAAPAVPAALQVAANIPGISAFPGALAALAAQAVTTNRSRVSSLSSFAGEETGDVKETQADMQPDALQEVDTESGAGDINASTQTGGPAT